MASASVSKVDEILRAAETVSNKLAALKMQLHPRTDSPTGKLSNVEIEMLRHSIEIFSENLNEINDHIKRRTGSQIQSTPKKVAMEEVGVPIRQQHSFTQQQTAQQADIQQVQQQKQASNNPDRSDVWRMTS